VACGRNTEELVWIVLEVTVEDNLISGEA